jgi:hypothetical protein
MVIKFIVFAILIESLVELFFKAAPLQRIRHWIINKTPFLEVDEQHLLDCKYCVSFWVSVVVVLVMVFFDNTITRTFGFIIVVARLSNFIHIIYAIVFNGKMNMILRRK